MTGLQHQEHLRSGVEAEAQELLSYLREKDNEKGTEDLMGMPANKRNQIYVQLALLGKERERLSVDELHQKFWAILRKPACPRRIVRRVGEAWHALSPPQPAKGWRGAPRAYQDIGPDGKSVDCFGWKWAGVTERARIFRRMFNKETRAQLQRLAANLLGFRSQREFISPEEQKEMLKENEGNLSIVSGSSA